MITIFFTFVLVIAYMAFEFSAPHQIVYAEPLEGSPQIQYLLEEHHN